MNSHLSAARDWVIRMQDPQFDAWDAFTVWLEADSAHLAAYDAAVVAEEDMAALVAEIPARPLPANDAPEAPEPVRRRWAGFGLVAASALLGVVGYQTMLRDTPAKAVQTAAGEHRTLTLADGTQVAMNGDTRILIDEDTPRTLVLERGQALFRVTHDEKKPFIVEAGQVRLLDAGTVFDVVRDPGSTRVAVAEGAVVVNPERQAYRLLPGKALAVDDALGTTLVSSIATDAVGGWRSGRLSYADAPLDRVAADLARSLGQPVRLAPSTGKRRFTGTLALDSDPAQALARVAPLLGCRATRNGAGWTLTPNDGATP